MLTLLLAMALLVIFAAVIVPSITFDIKRDREEEMIHRGVQYSRAIRAYYKKFGRYPTKIEDLENTNNLRFLRKRYKDPLNCKNSKCADFKLLHFGEVQMTLSGGIGGGEHPRRNAGQRNERGADWRAHRLRRVFAAIDIWRQRRIRGKLQFFLRTESAERRPIRRQVRTRRSPASQASPDGSGTERFRQELPSDDSNGNSGSNQLGSGQIIGGPDRGSCQHQQRQDDSRVQSQEEIQGLGVCLRSGAGPGRSDHDSVPAATAGIRPVQGHTNPQNGQNGSGQNGTGFGNSFGTSPSGMQNNPNRRRVAGSERRIRRAILAAAAIGGGVRHSSSA